VYSIASSYLFWFEPSSSSSRFVLKLSFSPLFCTDGYHVQFSCLSDLRTSEKYERSNYVRVVSRCICTLVDSEIRVVLCVSHHCARITGTRNNTSYTNNKTIAYFVRNYLYRRSCCPHCGRNNYARATAKRTGRSVAMNCTSVLLIYAHQLLGVINNISLLYLLRAASHEK
jgi:hypothetical protein